MRRKGLLVTGTDTNVGKTVTAAALMHRYRHLGALRYWKPVQTGIESDDDTATVRQLGACIEDELLLDGIRLQGAVAPYLAADRAGTRVDSGSLCTLLARQPDGQRWIVEGAGGVMVPLNATEMTTDLIAGLALPALIVARSGLGTINHSLLTLEALRRRDIAIAGVVLIGPRNDENRRAIETYGSVSVIGEMPVLTNLTAETLKHWAVSELDPGGCLGEHLQ